jgi:hypothetical protein
MISNFTLSIGNISILLSMVFWALWMILMTNAVVTRRFKIGVGRRFMIANLLYILLGMTITLTIFVWNL